MPTRKLTVRSARLSSHDDKKFLAVHNIYKAAYDKQMRSAGYDDFHDWRIADTLTRLVRETFERLDAANHPLNLELFKEEEGDSK